MPNLRTTDEIPATLPLTGAELVRIVQGAGNAKTTTQDITDILALNLADATDGSKGASGIGFLDSLTYAASTVGKWLTDLKTAIGATKIGYSQGGMGAALMTVSSYLRLGKVPPEAWGATGIDSANPLSNLFSTLVAAQAVYGPAATALTDELDGVVIQSMIDNGVRVIGSPNSVYRTTNGIHISTPGSYCEGSARWSAAANLNSTVGTSTLKYVGTGGSNSYVALLSTAAIGVAPSGGSANLQNIVFKNWTLDAGDVAEYSGVFVRAFQGNDLDNLTFTGARVCCSASLLGFVNAPRNWTAYIARGAGFWLGKDIWSWGGSETDDEIRPDNWFAYFIGVDPITLASTNTFVDDGTTYPASSNPDATCGFAIYGARGIDMSNVQGSIIDGPGIYIAPTLHGPIILDGGYLENCGQSSGASRHWATWINTAADGSSWGIRIRDIAFQGTTPAHRITGTQSSRQQSGLKFQNCPIMGTVVADLAYVNWGMVDCDPTVTLVGGYPVTPVTSPGGFSTEPGGVSFRYRSGTFTPTFAGATSAGTGRTYSIQAASWERVGRMVTVRGQITLTAAGTGDTGTMSITNLPFTVQNGQAYNASGSTSNSAGMTTSIVSLTSRAVANTTQLQFYKRTAAAAAETTLLLADISATTSFVFSVCYPTSDA